MKFVELGSYDESALEYQTEVPPLLYAEKIHLFQLDYILGFIKKRKPEILQQFIEKISQGEVPHHSVVMTFDDADLFST